MQPLLYNKFCFWRLVIEFVYGKNTASNIRRQKPNVNDQIFSRK